MDITNEAVRPASKPIEDLPWVCELLQISDRNAYEMARTGKLPGVFKVGSQWRINVRLFWAGIDEASERRKETNHGACSDH